jgi:hypothetical protein
MMDASITAYLTSLVFLFFVKDNNNNNNNNNNNRNNNRNKKAVNIVSKEIPKEKEILPKEKEKKTLYSVYNLYKSSIFYFLESDIKRYIGLLLAIRVIPSLIFTPMQDHYRSKFNWGSEKRSSLGVFTTLSQLFVPLILVELFGGIKFKQPKDALKWSMRLSVLSQLNTALTPIPNSVFLNGIIESIIPAERFVDNALSIVGIIIYYYYY